MEENRFKGIRNLWLSAAPRLVPLTFTFSLTTPTSTTMCLTIDLASLPKLEGDHYDNNYILWSTRVRDALIIEGEELWDAVLGYEFNSARRAAAVIRFTLDDTALKETSHIPYDNPEKLWAHLRSLYGDM